MLDAKKRYWTAETFSKYRSGVCLQFPALSQT